MKSTLNEKIIAYLTLLSGLSVSAVAVYYSVSGLTSIFAAAVVPIIVMGITLEIGKIVATLWLKQNWNTSPWAIKIYLSVAVALLMVITSMGIFGFLSKSHSDQNLVSSDVTAKIAVYDEKIKTEKDNIDANRKILKQLDEGVDQVMARSQDEKGADKAVAIRKAQQKDRSRISQEIIQSQKTIATLNDERAPIAAEVRKVDAEVGPIKYLAVFFYGNTDPQILERAVTWIIVLIIVVFDPLALMLLISSQVSFQKLNQTQPTTETITEQETPAEAFTMPEPTIAELDSFVGEKPTAEELKAIDEVLTPVVTNSDPIDNTPLTTELLSEPISAPQPINSREESRTVRTKVFPKKTSVIIPLPETYVQNEEQTESNLWTNTTSSSITQQEYIVKAEEHKNSISITDLVERNVTFYEQGIKSGRYTLDDVPPDLRTMVKARL